VRVHGAYLIKFHTRTIRHFECVFASLGVAFVGLIVYTQVVSANCTSMAPDKVMDISLKKYEFFRVA
jgi:hypothetical protein